MELAHRRHDISDETWQLLELHLPGRKGAWGGNARNNREFINVVFWILRSGAPWGDLPPDYGGWKNTRRRFCRWRDRGVWEFLLELLVDEPDYEWLMIDDSHIKVHQHAAREPKVAIKRWAAQKGAQHQDTLGRGYSMHRHLGQNPLTIFPSELRSCLKHKKTGDDPVFYNKRNISRLYIP